MLIPLPRFVKTALRREITFVVHQPIGYDAAVLRIEHLRVDFPDVVAVNDLSLEVLPGDACALIGPNGAGKTTTLRTAAGLQEPTRGTIAVDHLQLADIPQELKRRIGFMPDFAPVYDQLTVTEFLDHFARAYAVPNRPQRIRDCIEQVWLTEKTAALCDGLSRGMKQRLMLAKALLHEPSVLLLDEPASGLDPNGRIELRNLLLKLRAAGKAILISSHILTELSGFCNKVAIMERGRLVRSGLITELGLTEGRRRWLLKWRAPDQPARQTLAAAAGVTHVEPVNNGTAFEFAGTDDDLEALLRQLLANDVRVTEWRSLDGDLEQIFLKSGAKELM